MFLVSSDCVLAAKLTLNVSPIESSSFVCARRFSSARACWRDSRLVKDGLVKSSTASKAG